MADIMLHGSSLNQVTCVCNTFIDEYMGEANGEYVKIYLYLLRCFNSQDLCLSLSSIADKLEHTEKDVVRALKYWAKKGLVRLEYDDNKEIIGISVLDPQGHDTLSSPVIKQVKDTKETERQEAVTLPASIPAVSGAPSLTAAERDALTKDPAVNELLFLAQTYLCHPLSLTEMDYILSWYQELNMKPDLITYMMESCIDNGHNSIHYMNGVALGWTKDGITTTEQAIENNRKYSNCNNAVLKAFGLSGRTLTPSELEYVNKWSKDFGFSAELITEACNRTVMQTSKPSFKYADSILTSWHKNNFTSISDIKESDTRFVATSAAKLNTSRKNSKNSFNSFSQRDIDYEALEKQLISNK